MVIKDEFNVVASGFGFDVIPLKRWNNIQTQKMIKIQM